MTRLAYCTGMRRWACVTVTTSATTTIRKAIRATSSMAPMGTTAPSLYTRVFQARVTAPGRA